MAKAGCGDEIEYTSVVSIATCGEAQPDIINKDEIQRVFLLGWSKIKSSIFIPVDDICEQIPPRAPFRKFLI